jgi:hypothetical protein
MEEHENDPRLLITVEEGARRLSIGRSHLYKHLQSGALRRCSSGVRGASRSPTSIGSLLAGSMRASSS